LIDYVSEQLMLLQRFFVVLCGIKRPSSPLHRLGGDPGIRRHIASFLDIPRVFHVPLGSYEHELRCHLSLYARPHEVSIR